MSQKKEEFPPLFYISVSSTRSPMKLIV